MTWLLDDEPALAADEIQGHVLVGFGAAPQALGAFTARNLAAAAATVSAWAGRVTSTRALMQRKGHKARDVVKRSGPWLTIAVSHRLLAAAAVPSAFDDTWFTSPEGMAGITELNDIEPQNGGDLASDWIVGSPERPIDVLVVVAAGKTEAAEEVIQWFANDSAPWTEAAFNETLCPLKGSIEHFGFRDGISQPAVLGTIDGAAFEDDRVPDNGLVPYARPGQELTWPGNFIFGYPGRYRYNRRLAGRVICPSDPATAEFARNGSLLVYRRLRQDVAGFRAACRDTAAALAAHRYPGLTGEHLQALLVGRWPNGVPVAKHPSPGTIDDRILNEFTFYDDEMAEACPRSAHIRKVNPRLGGSDLDNVVPRLLRRGAPFGPPYVENEKPPANGRGLAFMAYQTSVERQFGALSTRWMNSASAPNGGGGHDLLVGQTPAGRGRSLELQCPDGSPCPVDVGTRHWVTMTGGGLLFTPSISALRSLSHPTP